MPAEDTCSVHREMVQAVIDVKEDLRVMKAQTTEMYVAMVGDMHAEGHVGKTNRRLAEHDSRLGWIGKSIWMLGGISAAALVGQVLAKVAL